MNVPWGVILTAPRGGLRKRVGRAVLLRAQSLLCLPESSGGRVHSLAFLSSADDEAMATEVAPPASAELTELGKCLTQQEVRAPALTATTLSL